MTTNTLTVEVKFGSDGKVDEDATLDAATDSLASFIADRESAEASVAAAVSSVFDANRGATLTMPNVAFLAGGELGLHRENFSTMSKRITDYLRSNSKGESSLYVSTKGPKGGIQRRSDIVAPPVKQ